MIPVAWMSIDPGKGERGAWDMGIVEELTAGPEFQHIEDNQINALEGAVIVIAGQHMVPYAPLVAAFAKALPWSLVIVTSDEEALYPVESLPHDERHVTFGQYHARAEFDRVIPIGAPPGARDLIEEFFGDDRENAVTFMGQDTHPRRHELMEVLKGMGCDPRRYGDIGWCATTGFSQGMPRRDYMFALTNTRIAPCPSGPHSLDSFRLYEAIAAGALPVIEYQTPHGDEGEFWLKLFGASCPLAMVQTWRDLPQFVEYYQEHPEFWIAERDKVQDWWRSYRAGLTLDFKLTIERIRS